MSDTPDPERAAFEAWAESNGFIALPGDSDEYRDRYLNAMRLTWKAWQARASIAAPAAETAPTKEQLVHALRLAYDAMNYMGDILNGMDAVEDEDEEATAPAFEVVRAALAALPAPPSTQEEASHG